MALRAADDRRDPESLVLEYLETGRADLKDLIILEMSPMVERIARKFAGIETVDDLVQVGYIGLLNALTKFDPEAGVRFSTYATHLVTGEIRHHLRDKCQTIRHPAWLQEMRHKVQKATTALQAQLSRQPTIREIAEYAELSEEAIGDVYATQELLKIASLDSTPNDDDDGDTELDRFDASFMEPDQLGVEDRMLLEQAMEQLRELEQEVLVLFHFESLNQTEIAQRLGISCNYVSHILRQSLSKLRRILTAEEREEQALRGEQDRGSRSIDPETGIYSDRYFNSRLVEEVHRVCSEDSVLSVILIEMTGLEAVRSFFGADSVTELLIDAGDILRGTVRGLDIVCRWEEFGFGLILPSTGETVTIARDRIGKKLTQWLLTRMGEQNRVGFRIGYASAPDDANQGPKLIAAAKERFVDPSRGEVHQAA